MDKRILVIVCTIVLLIVGGVMYLSSRPDNGGDSRTVTDQAAADASSTGLSADNGTTSPTGSAADRYVEYQDGIIAQTSGTKLLFFHASWCPQCRKLEADILKQGVPADVTIIKVDYDSNQKLRQQYNVTLQTTVVKVDDGGKAVEKFVAYDDPSLAAVVKELL